jgi:hypothetical protein
MENVFSTQLEEVACQINKFEIEQNEKLIDICEVEQKFEKIMQQESELTWRQEVILKIKRVTQGKIVNTNKEYPKLANNCALDDFVLTSHYFVSEGWRGAIPSMISIDFRPAEGENIFWNIGENTESSGGV